MSDYEHIYVNEDGTTGRVLGSTMKLDAVQLLSLIYSFNKGEIHTGGTEGAIQASRGLISVLNRARVFEISGVAARAFMAKAAAECVLGVTSQHYLDNLVAVLGNRSASPEELGILGQSLVDAGREAPGPDPERMPFPAIFIGYKGGFLLTDSWEYGRRIPDRLVDPSERYLILAHIITGDVIYEICGGIVVNDGVVGPHSLGTITQQTIWDSNNGWNRAYQPSTGSITTLGFHTMLSVIEALFDHTSYVEERLQFKQRRAVKKLVKKGRLGHIPPAFYKVTLRDNHRVETPKRTTGTGVARTYRHDVRRHEKLRYQRGEGAINPQLYTKLRKRGYHIFRAGSVPKRIKKRLRKRHIGLPRDNEWMAVLISVVTAHISPNDESLPYRPAVRHSPALSETKFETLEW